MRQWRNMQLNRPITMCIAQFNLYLVVLVAILPITRPPIASHNLARFNPGINPGIPGLSKLNPEIPGLAKRSGIAFPSRTVIITPSTDVRLTIPVGPLERCSVRCRWWCPCRRSMRNTTRPASAHRRNIETLNLPSHRNFPILCPPRHPVTSLRLCCISQSRVSVSVDINDSSAAWLFGQHTSYASNVDKM